MWKINSKILMLVGGALGFGSTTGAVPQLPGVTPPIAKSARIAHSPLPPRLRLGASLLLIREVRPTGSNAGNGGGCWTHCFNTYDECIGTDEKNRCVARVKICMETCDRLSGVENSTQRGTASGTR